MKEEKNGHNMRDGICINCGCIKEDLAFDESCRGDLKVSKSSNKQSETMMSPNKEKTTI